MSMIEIKYTGEALWKGSNEPWKKSKIRMRRVTQALNEADIPYAIIGGNAVQHWVAQVDESAVETLRMSISFSMSQIWNGRSWHWNPVDSTFAGAAGVSMFLDGPNAKARDAVHVVFAGRKVREEYRNPYQISISTL